MNKNIGAKLERMINTVLSTKWNKIHIGGMRIRGKKETKKSLRGV